MRSEHGLASALSAGVRLGWVPAGTLALVVAALASGNGRRWSRPATWMGLALVGPSLHLVEVLLLQVVWPALMRQGPRP